MTSIQKNLHHQPDFIERFRAITTIHSLSKSALQTDPRWTQSASPAGVPQSHSHHIQQRSAVLIYHPTFIETTATTAAAATSARTTTAAAADILRVGRTAAATGTISSRRRCYSMLPGILKERTGGKTTDNKESEIYLLENSQTFLFVFEFGAGGCSEIGTIWRWKIDDVKIPFNYGSHVCRCRRRRARVMFCLLLLGVGELWWELYVGGNLRTGE